MKKKFKEENGSIIVLTAFAMIVLIMFVGLGIDFTIMVMRQNELNNMSQIVREDRFAYQDTIRYANKPYDEFFNKTKETLDENGFKGGYNLIYCEVNRNDPKTWDEAKREYRTQVEVYEEFPFYFLRGFGMPPVTLRKTIVGGQIITGGGETDLDRVWHPDGNIEDYRKKYEVAPGNTSTTSVPLPNSEVPKEWKADLGITT